MKELVSMKEPLINQENLPRARSRRLWAAGQRAHPDVRK